MPCTAELVCIDPKRVADFWPHSREFIKSACDRTGLVSIEDIEREVLSGLSLLWLAWSDRIEAAATTALIKSPLGKVCIITACGGEKMQRWFPLISKIEAYAKDEGCARTRIIGRKGWVEVLDGYKDTYAIMDKVI